jgi:hypothetical protein
MTLRVECGEALLAGTGLQPIEVGGALRWSETLASGQTSVNAAPAASAAHLAVVLTLVPEATGWVSIGPPPDASVAALRRRMISGVPRSFLAPQGVRVAWIVG